jgi:branched-chain amino acid transport system ATP-binding protein
MLKIDDIHVYRGRTYVLKGICLEVNQGEIVALIGSNGAGKTTTLRTISGLLRPKEGCITFQTDSKAEPLDIGRIRAEEIVRLGISHCPEGRGVFAQLSVKENLILGAYLRKDQQKVAKDLAHVHELFPILEERSGQMAGSLSGGEQAMLAVGRALMSRPKLLILDEPSLGLAPMVVESIFKILSRINAEGITVLLVEQNAVMALQLAHRAYVMENGQVVLSGTGHELACNDDVRRSYLGEA